MRAVPDTAFTQICQSNCCECAEASHMAVAAALKNRSFQIMGSINVIETLTVREKKRAAENSTSIQEKDTICVLNNQAGLGANQQCVNVTVSTCPPNNGSGLGSIGPGMSFHNSI